MVGYGTFALVAGFALLLGALVAEPLLRWRAARLTAFHQAGCPHCHSFVVVSGDAQNMREVLERHIRNCGKRIDHDALRFGEWKRRLDHGEQRHLQQLRGALRRDSHRFSGNAPVFTAEDRQFLRDCGIFDEESQ